MKNYTIALLFPFVFYAGGSTGTEFKVPEHYSFKYSIDYAPYEKTVLQCLDWLENTPLTQDEAKHKAAVKFLFDWINGAPNVHVEIDATIMDIKSVKNFPLLVLYMAGWSRYELAHQDKTDKVQAFMAGLHTMFKVYQKGEGIKKDRLIEELIAKEKKGTLETWVKETIANHKS